MNQKTLIPISILIAGLLVAGAVFYSNRQSTGPAANIPTDGSVEIAINPVDENDWIQGNIDAKVVLVEYSDTECPFCQRLHETMNELVSEYDSSDLAWVYRHLPLTQLHSKAGIEAVALECAGELGGNDGFWNYTNQLYKETPSNNGLDLRRLPEMAEENGFDRTAFEACLDDSTKEDEVKRDAEDAMRSAAHLGGSVGTPYTIMVSQTEFNAETLATLEGIAAQYNQAGRTIVAISDDKKRASLSGALPKEMWKAIIDAAVN